MRVLFVGSHPRARALFRLLCGRDRQAVLHSANGLTSVRLLLETGNRYDFAILSGREGTADCLAMAGELRAANPRVTIAYLSMAEQEPPRARGWNRLLGAFEKSSQGPRMLNCVLALPSAAAGNCARDLGEVIFEYQAPCTPKRAIAP
ncbi:hypothetical protein DESUT3_08270 [Desulfuromonas versatilis]|uniref:Response regulator receiver protein n=1 Tax=Desulfuromonas versatilis TaxID=2802975 RepID=A0ABM8HMX7_9BACT|nr:response regulator [Desulfuromonas versatilis]BCR03758.1 hypothetical protein DESUT3_08270 [Desulfuromonas versatilis]